jgi:hypothetical protein
MSKNNKQLKKAMLAAEFSSMRKGGGKGPSHTAKKNSKKNTWWGKAHTTQHEGD